MGKIFVTGATGNVGGYVCSSLFDMNESVAAGISELSRSKIDKVDNRAECRLFDFTDCSTYEAALKDVDRVFLMRPPHLGRPEDIQPFIRAMKAKDIKLVVFLSLMGVEKNPVPPHYKIEKFIEREGLPFVHIRPGFFMQNLTGVHLNEIRTSGEIFIPAGSSKCSFIDAMDIGYAAALILANPGKHKNKAYTITGPEALDYYEIAEILTKVLNRTIRYARPSIMQFRRHMKNARNFDKKYINVTTMLYLMTRLGTAEKVTDDFERLTGRQPTSFKRFAERNVKLFNEFL